MPLNVKFNHDADKMSEALGISQDELESLVEEYLKLRKSNELKTKFLEKVCQEKDDKRLLFFILTFGIDQGIDIGRDQMVKTVSDALASLPPDIGIAVIVGLAAYLHDKKDDDNNAKSFFGLN